VVKQFAKLIASYSYKELRYTPKHPLGSPESAFADDMHYACPNRANGFRFINDPAVAINYLKQKGYRKILYIDLDTYHCNSVQDGFY
jgi:hypothetical protein